MENKLWRKCATPGNNLAILFGLPIFHINVEMSDLFTRKTNCDATWTKLFKTIKTSHLKKSLTLKADNYI